MSATPKRKDGLQWFFEVFIGKPAKNMVPKQGIYAFHKGQLLGCDATAALDIEENVDSFIYLGTGEFHPLHLAYDTEKPIWLANPLTKTVKISFFTFHVSLDGYVRIMRTGHSSGARGLKISTCTPYYA